MKAAEATCTYFNLMTQHFKIEMRIQQLVKHVFFSKNSVLDVWLGCRTIAPEEAVVWIPFDWVQNTPLEKMLLEF